ncbi:conserved hypothetical protein [Pediculus humanus corporis]|uniref:U3 small nucleolar RNA-associated protein 25 homolog n=1 Tax=Pediculus humanus subsp. corporis TaxID=121224 RepID=E0V952_PEDHC|nr:uncharacterized protein Phum_PHUM004110 [Pediculus humanus corporis]EEB09908.1 conserved hypothetical protein [Pediculus humanus corporis]
MGRNKIQKKKKEKKNFKKFATKNPKKKFQTFRDIKHSEQYAEYKLKLENEKKKVEIVEEEDEEPDNDPVSLLLSTFKNNTSKSQENVAIDSEEDSSDESKLSDDDMHAADEFAEGLENNKKQNESDLQLDHIDNSLNDCHNESIEDYNESDNDSIKSNDENEIDLDNEEAIEAETNDKNDPFCVHLNYDLPESLIESLTSVPMNVKTDKMYWPSLHNLKVEIPSSNSEKFNQLNSEMVSINNDVEYAKEYESPVLIKSVDYSKLYIKTQIHKNIEEANKLCEFTPLQKEIFSIINNYQDLYYCNRNLNNGEEIRFIYCLHSVNHILKTRLKILHHNNKLYKTIRDLPPDEYRDQGLVRPKVVIIVPFRNSCLRIVNTMCSILLPDKKSNIINKKRFYDEFKGSELHMPKKNPKPEDYEQLFKGNIDDNFRIGLNFTRKSIKLYSDFYSSDIIIASPLGLRMVIGAEGDKERDFDFLASVEILILDQAEVFLMQNWDHLLLIFEHLHIQPKESHGVDFSRVRSWALNGWTKYYRQTLLFSSFPFTELNAIFNRRCFNYGGKIRVANPVEDGSICRVVVPLSHIYQRFETDSAVNSLDDRFKYFTEKILPQFKDPIMTGVLIYVPSYFDYVRIRNYLKQSDYNFVQICEYSKDSKVARARDMFFHNEVRILLYSERFHFYRRITVKGIRHLVFYQLPIMPNFYSELCNLMQDANQNKFLSNDSLMTVTVLYCKYDVHQLGNVVKTSRAGKMLSSDKNIHMFSTG